MENDDGVLLTYPTEIQKEAIKYYEKLFEDLPIDPEFMEVQVYKDNLCKMWLNLCAQNKTGNWTHNT